VKLIVFHPDADVEITEAAQYYEVHIPGLGSDFLGEVERALDQITTNPEASRRIGRRVRRKPLWRFPYNLIHAAYPDRIRIVACAH
jgi:toxin ParE1/3/4